MEPRPKMDPETRRKFAIFVGLAYLSLVPSGLHAYFLLTHRAVWAVVTGVLVVVCYGATFLYYRRSGISQMRHGRPRD